MHARACVCVCVCVCHVQGMSTEAGSSRDSAEALLTSLILSTCRSRNDLCTGSFLETDTMFKTAELAPSGLPLSHTPSRREMTHVGMPRASIDIPARQAPAPGRSLHLQRKGDGQQGDDAPTSLLLTAQNLHSLLQCLDARSHAKRNAQVRARERHADATINE